ncbi:MAG: hypothetical protein QM767_12065 [Anaeromyxobacter sp.]
MPGNRSSAASKLPFPNWSTHSSSLRVSASWSAAMPFTPWAMAPNPPAKRPASMAASVSPAAWAWVTRVSSSTRPRRLPRTWSRIPFTWRFLPGSGGSVASKLPRAYSATVCMARPIMVTWLCTMAFTPSPISRYAPANRLASTAASKSPASCSRLMRASSPSTPCTLAESVSTHWAT